VIRFAGSMSSETPHNERTPLLGSQSNGNAAYSSTAEVRNLPDPGRTEEGTAASKQVSGLNLRYILPALSIGV
jgi:hypothetical protein